MRLWVIAVLYVAGSILAGLIFPRLEHDYLPYAAHTISVGSAQAFLSSVTSGMMALTGIVFSLAFVILQFAGMAYSPRLVLVFARDRTIFHALGMFIATFGYALATLAWVDRGGDGLVPLYSMTIVALLLCLSMISLTRLVQRLGALQITRVLRFVGGAGREVIGAMPLLDVKSDGELNAWRTSVEQGRLGPVTQKLHYSGEPRCVTNLDVEALVECAQRSGSILVFECAIGDALVAYTVILRVHGAGEQLPENVLMRSIHLEAERTFEHDPKYAIRLLVDIAIKALSPAVNDPTTAVQSLDEIEDLLCRLGRCELDSGYVADAHGHLRLVFPAPTWSDYVALAFDEIRECGATQVQVMRRMRAALNNLASSVATTERANVVRRYLQHLDRVLDYSWRDAEDRETARQEDRQGIGLSRGDKARSGVP
ncbi:MAG: DUF2254 domain-containing protein [Vulcanimicrobiaceae bacterium]